ncbi:unnamed protein product [Pieris macdunnoughi]|uniref:Uncharacterized protein n=1 Tax=Pieris macdunnoughi TaxID=345717 RepID=A0A821SQI5_9NEOP|nr:unnamed protein product [Pieris macdunnoughi]
MRFETCYSFYGRGKARKRLTNKFSMPQMRVVQSSTPFTKVSLTEGRCGTGGRRHRSDFVSPPGCTSARHLHNTCPGYFHSIQGITHCNPGTVHKGVRENWRDGAAGRVRRTSGVRRCRYDTLESKSEWRGARHFSYFRCDSRQPRLLQPLPRLPYNMPH